MAAQLEGSKGFTKDLCRKYGIPTAAYERFAAAEEAKRYVTAQGAPIVVKADGLAAGKGVVVAETVTQAHAAIDMMFSGGLGGAGAEVVVEEFLTGEEVSFFALCDGEAAIPFGSAQDHKRAFDGDTGPNTGGMGAYSPAPILPERDQRAMLDTFILPTLAAMRAEGCPFTGILYAGLMMTPAGPKLIEYNVRFGDPECQVLMLRLKSDLVPALIAARDGQLKNFDLRWSDDVALTVVMATKGYPGGYRGGSTIGGLESAAQVEGVEIFHAGTARAGDALVANGGRVLTVSARGATVRQARERAYAAVDLVRWDDGNCRRAIGWRALEREAAAVR
jgi:phosphoribosylamine--glycine ligase